MINNLISNHNLNSNKKYELNNKLALQCSSLINEIKRKNSELLLPIYIKNKRLYIKKKILSNKSNKFNNKGVNNLKKLISRNIHKNDSSNNFSEGNINIKNNKLIQLNRNISVSSVYKLPKIKPQKRMNKNWSVIINSNNLRKKPEPEETKNNSSHKKDNFLGIENFMKEKFYSDTDNKFRNKIKTKYFRNDGNIKEKIIFLKKFGIFWRAFIQYCGPIINLKKFKINYENKNGNKINNNIKGTVNNSFENINNNTYKIKSLSFPKIYSQKI